MHGAAVERNGESMGRQVVCLWLYPLPSATTDIHGSAHSLCNRDGSDYYFNP